MKDVLQRLERHRRRYGAARLLRYGAETAAAYAAYGFFRLLPLDAASFTGGWIMRKIGPRLKRTEKVVLPQLALAFPEMDDAARHKTMVAMWDNIGRVFAEYAHLDDIWPRVTLAGAEHLAAARDSGRPVIFVGGHVGNWELAAIAVQKGGDIPLHSIYRAPNNAGVEKILRRAREAGSAGQLIPKGASGARRILSVLRQKGAVGMLVDQKLTGAPPVPFFGRPALTAPAVAMFAIRQKALLHPIRVERLAGAHFRVTVEPDMNAESYGAGDAAVAALLGDINRRLESWIRVHPSQWLWTHRRWDGA